MLFQEVGRIKEVIRASVAWAEEYLREQNLNSIYPFRR